MKRTLLGIIILLSSIYVGCAVLTPIVKVNRHYSPRANAVIVDSVPANTIFIGTVKIVPGDDGLIRPKKLNKVINCLLEEAAEAGADYVYVRDISKSNKDYFFDVDFADGYTVTGEMFRLVE